MRLRPLGFIVTFILLAAPLSANAQQPEKVFRVGYLNAGPGVSDAFRQALRQLGYVEGQNIIIESRFADQKLDRLPDLAAELARLKVDVIVTITTPAALAAKQATSDVRGPNDFDQAFAVMTRERADALVVLPNSLNGAHTKLIVDFAAKYRRLFDAM